MFRGTPTRRPLTRSSGIPQPRTLALPRPGAAGHRHKELDRPSCACHPRTSGRSRCPDRAQPDAAFTFSTGGASGSRTARSLSSFMLETRGDVGADKQRSRPSGKLSAGAGGRRSAEPALPRKHVASQQIAGPGAAGPPALDLGPAQRRHHPFTGAERSGPPPAPPGPGSKCARAQGHPPMARTRQGGWAAREGRSRKARIGQQRKGAGKGVLFRGRLANESSRKAYEGRRWHPNGFAGGERRPPTGCIWPLCPM